MENIDENLVEDPVDLKQSLAKKIGISALAASVFLSVIGTVSAVTVHSDVSDEISSSSNYSDASATDWAPLGFQVWSEDSNIAFKYLPVGSYSCSDYNCVKIQFISESGCPNGLYVAANYLDGPDGNVIGYDNATLPSLNAMQTAQLLFEDTSNTSRNWQLAEIRCR